MRTFAWAGAALFAGALAYFAWSFLGPFGHVATDGPVGPPLIVDTLLFSLFALHHSLLARTGAKAWLTRVIPPAVERSSYVWVASLLFIAVCTTWQPVPGVWWHSDGAVRWILMSLQGVGAWLTLYSASMLDVFELAGTRGFMRAKPEATELKSHGPYGLVRHPIYLAWLLLVWPPTTMTSTRLVFAIVSTLYLVVAIPFEERSLHASIGPSYAEYVTRVRWRLVPGLY